MNELIMSGLQLMALGMGVVFLFLTVLIGIVSLVSSLIMRLENKPETTAPAIDADAELREVVQNAVNRYRTDHPTH